MTLSTVPRFQESHVTEVGDHAIVIGASMAGMVAARVLADAFETVTVIDRDPLPDDPVARTGVPQAPQAHVLLEAGRATLEDLFPGYGESLIRDGGLVIDWATELSHYEAGDYLTDRAPRHPLYAASRPLFEATTRTHLDSNPAVTLRGDCPFVDYLVDEDVDTPDVDGVVVRPNGADGREQIPADLVVDATGRTSRTPTWLDEHGYRRPPVEEVTVDVTYSTMTVERPPDDRRAFFVPPTPPRTRGGGAFPIEDDRWLVTLQGVHGDDTPGDPDALVSFAESLPVEHLADLLTEQRWLQDTIRQYPFPSNVRRYYERLDEFPDGLLVLGDAMASYNPVYGQGMTVAALEALVLSHRLADYDPDTDGTIGAWLPAPYFDGASDVVDVAWDMAVGADLAYDQTNGSQSPTTELFTRYVEQVVAASHSDPTVAHAYSRVVGMEEHPTSLLHPRIFARVLSPWH